MRSLRKGIFDIVPRSKISDNCVNNFSNHLASFKQITPIKDLISPVCKSFSRKSKKIRALDIFGKDLELLKSISKFSYNASFITNKELQKTLKDSSWSKGKTGKKLSYLNFNSFKRIIIVFFYFAYCSKICTLSLNNTFFDSLFLNLL